MADGRLPCLALHWHDGRSEKKAATWQASFAAQQAAAFLLVNPDYANTS